MLWPKSLGSRILFLLLLLSIILFVTMDSLLYSRVTDYPVRPVANRVQYHSEIPCDLNPMCIVTVKGLMLDYPNFYMLSPLAAIVDRILGISDTWTLVTPNMISGFHVFVAIAAGKFVASDSLSKRRIGVLLFQIRTWLDDLDGHVARQRKHIGGERSDVGSTGYWVDGICDALGCVALMIGLYCYLLKNPAKRGYEKLQPLLPSIDGSGDIGVGVAYKKKHSNRYRYTK